MQSKGAEPHHPSALDDLVLAPRPAPLASEVLRRTTAFKKQPTDDASIEAISVGQDRALRAIRFGSEIARPDFNVFVMGAEGSGRHSAVRRILNERAAANPPPDDWVYVNNFKKTDHPRALRLPVGTASRFEAAMEELIADLGIAVPALFESDDYKTRRDAIDQQFEQAQEARFSHLNEMAQNNKIAILRTPMGFAFAPQRDGKVLPPEEFKALSEQDQKEIETEIETLQQELKKALSGLPRIEKDRRDRIRALNQDMAAALVAVEIADVEEALGDIPAVSSFLADVSKDIVQNVEVFIEKAAEDQESALPNILALTQRDPRLRRYTVNVMVGQDIAEGAPDSAEAEAVAAPVIIENNPTFQNLIGRIEHISQMGALLTDFTLIKPGALHRANGGYLVLDIRQVLSQPAAWDGLKRCLKAREIRISSLAEQYSLQSTISLQPDPIPLSVRVVLIGDRRLYYLLHALDPDFRDLFKIQADFEDDMARTEANAEALARLIARLCAEEGLKPLTPAGLGRVFDEAARLAGDAEKLSLQIDPLADILREADHLAGANGEIDAANIADAVAHRRDRASRLRERMHESITRDTVLIETDGKAVGQINGLSVIALGDEAFGRPNRITAATRLGTGKVIDIEREAKLGGPLHSKGVLILSGYLASYYATDVPMSLWASLVLEQSYGGVEGDSASSAELYALLSSLADLPINQAFAVTGSVNQKGEVQAIGGVNEKIEGFFDICAARGLTGDQGVLIPAANTKHLMLREDVVKACQDQKFSVHAVRTIDEGIALLTEVVAGERGPDGAFAPGTVNARVESNLEAFAQARRQFASEDGDDRDAR